jgi:hypothetical protein
MNGLLIRIPRGNSKIGTPLAFSKFSHFRIVGWEEQCHKAVSKLLHFGDEIVKVNENPTNFISDINTLFYASPVGVPIQLLIRSYPHGILKTLKKSIRISQKIGIVLHEGKNKVTFLSFQTLLTLINASNVIDCRN